MRHDVYRSPGRMVLLMFAVLVLVAVIVTGARMTGKPEDSSPKPSKANEPGSSVTMSNTPSIDNQALVEAVYSFVEFYNLPASVQRNEALKALSTPEGYKMVARDPQNQSPAEKAAGNIVITVIPASSSVQAEPFDDDVNAMSVYVTARIRLTRDGRVLRTVRLPGQTMSWVKQSDTWKFAYLQS